MAKFDQTHDGFCIYRYFGDDSYTSFENLKTKMKFQGIIGGKVDFEYHIPSGRYYLRGGIPPTHSLIDCLEEEINIIPKISTDDAFDDVNINLEVPF